MKQRLRLKKIIKWLIILPLLVILTGVLLLYFLIRFRFEESLKFIIDKETQGRYTFEAGKAAFSFSKRTVILKHSAIHCVDTSNIDTYYEVSIPEMYFSLDNWKSLLFDKKLIVDSLSLTDPDFKLYAHHGAAHKGRGAFHPTDILTILNKTLTRFNAHSLSLKNASVSYTQPNHSEPPLEIKQADLFIYNFTQVNDEDSHLLGSDKVQLRLGRQHWVLPNSGQTISFRQMSFNSEGQRFELDSFTYRQPVPGNKEDMVIQADKFLFNSQHLPAIYQKEQLLLDTLICYNPVLTLPKGDRNVKDSLPGAKISKQLFKWINVKFISVVNGELQLKGNEKDQQTAASQHANLSIFNLGIDSATNPQIQTDSIRLELKKIAFISRDSLWKLNIDEFRMNQEGVLFKNVSYGPNRPGNDAKKIMFTAPLLQLKNVDIGALAQKRLIASDAVLYRPEILLNSNKNGAAGKNAAKNKEEKMALFYQSLHGISELINVQNFRIVDGHVKLHSQGKTDMIADARKLDAHILLHKMFLSDSLVDIKHAIPDLRIEQLGLTTLGAQINVGNFRFDGVNRRNRGEKLIIDLANGTHLEGDDLYWEVFDWDIFQKTKAIQVDSLRLGRLAIRTGNNKSAGEKPTIKKTLPVIRISRLDIDDLTLDNNTPAIDLRMKGRNIQFTNIGTSSSYFTWEKANAYLTALHAKTRAFDVKVENMQFSNQEKSILNNIDLVSANKDGTTKLHIPQLQIQLPVHSTDFSQLSIPSLSGENMALEMQHKKGNDTINASAQIDLHLHGGHASPGTNVLFSFGTMNAGVRHARFNNNMVKLEIPEMNLQLVKGRLSKNKDGKVSLAASTDLHWKNATVRYGKDSSLMEANKLTGRLYIPELVSSGLQAKGAWKQLLDKIELDNGQITYRGKKITASIDSIHWDPGSKTMDLSTVKVFPVADREQTFKSARWQGDYITFQGRSVRLSGIHLGETPTDSLIHISQIALDDAQLDASRDKRIPFHHGIEKPMPTKLIGEITFPLRIDAIHIRNSAVAYHEITTKTNQWTTIPLHDIDGSILRIDSRGNLQDSLTVIASGRVFDGAIEQLHYKESYGDSLSGFTAQLRLLPINLPAMGHKAMPTAPVLITRGNTDTINSKWSGNKYAAYGNMHFYYKDLRIKIRSRKRPDGGGILPAIETWIANLILPDSKQKPSLIFFERDRERFVFNYWIKTQINGVLSTMGLRKNKSYRKQYRKKRGSYSLPAEENAFRQP